MTTEEQLEALRAEGFDFSNTYTTQEGCIYEMTGATCPRCEAKSELAHRTAWGAAADV